MIKVKDAIEAQGAAKQVANTLKPFVTLALLSGGAGLLSYMAAKRSQKEEIEELKKSYNQIYAGNSAFQKDPATFAERFNELSVIAPTIAKNPKMATKVIEPRMKKGFEVDDIHKLTVIQAHSRGNLSADPGSAGRAAGMMAFDRLVTSFGPMMYAETKPRGMAIAQATDEMRRRAAHMGIDDKSYQEWMKMKKQGSETQRVSDACLGEMLADRYVMVKQAGLGDIIRAGASDMKKGLALFAPALALGGAVYAAGEIVDRIKAKKMEEAAQEAFLKVKKDSEVIKSNPQLAAEAFDTIKSFAPALAAKPQILKSFLEHTVRTEILAPQTANDLAIAQANIAKAQSSPGFATGFFGAAKPVLSTGGDLMSIGAKAVKPGYSRNG